MRKAIVLMSGGIDSATCMALACGEFPEVIPVHFDYGQQTAGIEQKMTTEQLIHLSGSYPDVSIPKTPIIRYERVFQHFTEGVADSDEEFNDQTKPDGRSSGYVPMRNLHFIATAAAYADVRDANAIFHGAQGGDEADYPDCRPAFMTSAENAINRSLPEGEKVELRAPLIYDSKEEVINKGDDLGVDFSFTYSCYTEVDDVDSPTACGECPACIERKEAFAEARIRDPIPME